MEKTQKVKRFPSYEEFHKRLTFEKCVRSITGMERTDRANNWMERFLKDEGAGKDTWFHRKELPGDGPSSCYHTARLCFGLVAEFKKREISRSASERGKERGKRRGARRPELNRKDKPIMEALRDAAEPERKKRTERNARERELRKLRLEKRQNE
jgi:hypothetical protein